MAAVAGQKDAAMRIGRIGVPERRHQRHIGVGRVHKYRSDVRGLGKANMTPGTSAVIRAPDSVSEVYRPPCRAGDAKIAGTDVNYSAIRRRDCERTDRGHRHLVEDRLPDLPSVRGFPNATAGTRHVVGTRLPGYPGHPGNATPAKGTYLPPLHAAVQSGVELARF